MRPRDDLLETEGGALAEAGLGLIVLVGLALRLFGAGDQWVLSDEVFTLRAAVTQKAAWIWSHVGFFDHSIPVSLYAHWLSHTNRLSEWTLRLPELVAGCATLVAGAVYARRLLSPVHAILCVGLFAVSPIFVAHAREARPYSSMLLLFAIGSILTVGWCRERRRAWLVGAAAAFAIAGFFHAIVAPSLAAIALLLASFVFVLPERRERLVDGAIAAGVFLVLTGLLLGPALEDILNQARMRSGLGQVGSSSFSGAFLLIHGLPFLLPALFGLAWVAIGFGLSRAWRSWVTVCGALLIASQLVFLIAVRPALVESPAVTFRYFFHLSPLLLVWGTAPIAWALVIAGRRLRRPHLAESAAMALVAVLLVSHAFGDRYALGRSTAANFDPRAAYLPIGDAPGLAPPSSFYGGELLADSDAEAGHAVALVEAPFVAAFPLFRVYQRTTGRPILGGAVRQGFLAETLRPNVLAGLRTLVDIESPGALRASGARYLIWHKDVEHELGVVMRAALESEPAATMGVPVSAIPTHQTVEYGPTSPVLPASIGVHFDPVFEDDAVVVYDLAPRSEKNSIRPSYVHP